MCVQSDIYTNQRNAQGGKEHERIHREQGSAVPPAEYHHDGRFGNGSQRYSWRSAEDGRQGFGHRPGLEGVHRSGLRVR